VLNIELHHLEIELTGDNSWPSTKSIFGKKNANRRGYVDKSEKPSNDFKYRRKMAAPKIIWSTQSIIGIDSCDQ
jgi:hypothetical protein